MAHPSLNEVGQGSHAGGHDCVANCDGKRAILRRTDRTKLEAIATKRKWGGAVAVLHTADRGHRRGSLGVGGGLFGLEPVQRLSCNDLVHVSLEPSAGVQRDDGWRRLLRAQAVIIACMGHGAAHQLVVLVEAMGQARNSGDKKLAGGICFAWVEEVESCVSANRPVVVLPIAVDACKGLLMEKHVQAELLRLLLQDLHEEHIVVARKG